MTPEEIRSITFEKGMRGYRIEDVDDFLENTAKAMDALMAEKAEAEAAAQSRKEKMMVLAQKVEEYRAQLETYRAEEDTLRTALLNAQRMGDNVIREAKQKAESIVREANLKADSILSRSRDDLEEQEMELARVKAEVVRFKNEVLGLYKAHIELLTCKTFTDLDEEIAEETPAEEEMMVEAPVEEAVAEVPAEPEPAAEPLPAAEETPADREPADIQFDFDIAAPAAEEEKPAVPAGFDSFQGISFDD